jgi:Uma2 family endonuclease
MASAPTLPLVSVDEYLNTSYHPDAEFVDGVIIPRSMPTYPHSVLQLIIGSYLRKFRDEFHIGVASECRVELVERSLYRIPDLLLCSRPVNLADKALKSVPLAVVEISSPDDRMHQQMARFKEYWSRGVRQILIFDPEEFSAFRYTNGALIEGPIEEIELPAGKKIPFSSAEIFQTLKADLDRE